MSRFDHNSPEARITRVHDELELSRIRDQRNTRYIIKVMTRQHQETMAAIRALAHPPTDKQALLTFGKPGEKIDTKVPQPHPPQADKPKEKLR